MGHFWQWEKLSGKDEILDHIICQLNLSYTKGTSTCVLQL